jgi:hypothetical protein
MTTSLKDVTSAAESYGADQYAAGAASLADDVVDLTSQVALRTAERDAALKRVAELEPKPPVTRLPFGIGINEKAMSSKLPQKYTRAQLEKAAGVNFAYGREYFTYPTKGIDNTLLTYAELMLSGGRVPILSSKMPGNDWDGAANGKYDTVIDPTADALQTLVAKYRDKGFTRARAIKAEHHEFDNGDGPLAAFNAMTEHLLPIVRRPGDIEFWLNFTGYAQIYTPTKTAFTFDAVYRDGIDGYAIDPYQSTFQQTANAKKATFTDLVTGYFTPFAKWCDAKGIQKGVWETMLTALAQASTRAEAKVWLPHNADGAAGLGFTMWCPWNNNNPNSGNDWRIQDVAPAMTKDQLVTVMRKYAWSR